MSKILQLTHSDYLSHPAYGSSDLIKMSKSFAYWNWRKNYPEPAGRPLVVGSATHLMLQHAVTKTAIPKGAMEVYADGSSKTKGFKDFQDANRGSYCLDLEEFALSGRMVDALLKDPEVMSYLTGAIPEATILGCYPGTGVLCKCRPDYLHVGRGVSINVKTTTDASESGFIYAAKEYGYDWQSAFYCDLLTHQLGKSFDEIHILVEKTEEGEPPRIRIFSFGDDTLAWARTQLQTLLEKIPENEKSGVWPNTTTLLQTVDLPIYARRLVNL